MQGGPSLREKTIRKIQKQKSCSAGGHTFIPAVWKESGGKKVCELFVCQHCMVHFDKSEREVACLHHQNNE